MARKLRGSISHRSGVLKKGLDQWKSIKRDFTQGILAQGCSLIECILVLVIMMQCSCEVTLQGSGVTRD